MTTDDSNDPPTDSPKNPPLTGLQKLPLLKPKLRGCPGSRPLDRVTFRVTRMCRKAESEHSCGLSATV